MEDILFENRALVTAGGTFSRTNGQWFIIEVIAAGNVSYTTVGGQVVVSEPLAAGYHKMKLKSLQVSAVNVAVLFN